MTQSLRARTRREGGAALAEYGLLVAGITMASLVAVSVLGGKVGGLVASVATLLPGSIALFRRSHRATGPERPALIASGWK